MKKIFAFAVENILKVCRHLLKIYQAKYIFEKLAFSNCKFQSPSKWHYQKRKKNYNTFRPQEKNISDAVKNIYVNLNVLLLLKTNRTICNVFIKKCHKIKVQLADILGLKPLKIVHFFPRTGSDLDDVFCSFTNLTITGIEFKYYFTFRFKKIVQVKLYKVLSDTNVTVICDSRAFQSLFTSIKRHHSYIISQLRLLRVITP